MNTDLLEVDRGTWFSFHNDWDFVIETGRTFQFGNGTLTNDEQLRSFSPYYKLRFLRLTTPKQRLPVPMDPFLPAALNESMSLSQLDLFGLPCIRLSLITG